MRTMFFVFCIQRRPAATPVSCTLRPTPFCLQHLRGRLQAGLSAEEALLHQESTRNYEAPWITPIQAGSLRSDCHAVNSVAFVDTFVYGIDSLNRTATPKIMNRSRGISNWGQRKGSDTQRKHIQKASETERGGIE